MVVGRHPGVRPVGLVEHVRPGLGREPALRREPARRNGPGLVPVGDGEHDRLVRRRRSHALPGIDDQLAPPVLELGGRAVEGDRLDGQVAGVEDELVHRPGDRGRDRDRAVELAALRVVREADVIGLDVEVGGAESGNRESPAESDASPSGGEVVAGAWVVGGSVPGGSVAVGAVAVGGGALSVGP